MKSAQKKQEDTRLYYRFMVMLGVERRRMDGSGSIEVGKHEEMYSLGMVCDAYPTYSNAKH